MKYLNLICLLTLTFCFWPASAPVADVATLCRIAAAQRDVSYVGVRLKTRGTARGTKTMEELVIHKSAEDSYRKVLSIVGEKQPAEREHKRDADNRTRRRRGRERGKGREFSRWERNRSQFSQKEIELITENYHLKVEDRGEKTLGHETLLLMIEPKLPQRPSKYITFARKNGVILEVKDMDSEGTLREMFAYTRLSFEPEVVQAQWQKYQGEIHVPPRRSQPITHEEASRLLNDKLVQPAYLPTGFQLLELRSIKEKRAIHLTYTDGLLGFSIFETAGSRMRGERRGEKIHLHGTDVYKHERGHEDVFIWSHADIVFFLYGAVPSSEKLKVVASIVKQ